MPDSLKATPLVTLSLNDLPEYSTIDSLVVSPVMQAKEAMRAPNKQLAMLLLVPHR